MPAEIVNAEFCAQYWGTFEVPGSKGDVYTVDLEGGEGPAHCTCKGFQFRHDCKHIRQVWAEACLWNPQWHDAGPNTLKPIAINTSTLRDSKCPGCGGPTVAVRIAV